MTPKSKRHPARDGAYKTALLKQSKRDITGNGSHNQRQMNSKVVADGGGV
jgi:hypothetical protein